MRKSSCQSTLFRPSLVRLQPESSQDLRLVRAGKPLLRELLVLASHVKTVDACEISPLNSQA